MNTLPNQWTDKQIKRLYQPGEYHEHTDSVRIAGEWLSAQTEIQTPIYRAYALTHLIESWSGTYVSRHDVIVAAKLLRIKGKYPHFHISARAIEPDTSRLDYIRTHRYSNAEESVEYWRHEAV